MAFRTATSGIVKIIRVRMVFFGFESFFEFVLLFRPFNMAAVGDQTAWWGSTSTCALSAPLELFELDPGT